MHKRRKGFFLLFLVGLIILVSIITGPYSAYASPTGEYDYVDNNVSDVDASPDKGIHSNFTAQQYGPDSIYDTLTEENTGEGATTIAKIGTDTSGTGTALTLSFSHTLVVGSNRLVVVVIGIENGGTIDVGSVTYGGVAMTKAVEGITGTSGYRFLAEIWYILENDLPSDGSKTVQISCTGTVTSLEINGFCAEYTGVNQGIPEATDNTDEPSPADSTIENIISPSDDSWVISGVGCGNSGSFTHGQGQVEVLDFSDSSSTFAVAELRGANGETSLSSTYSGTANRLERVAAAWKGSVSVNYELDLEVQWTSATYDLPNEELCIYGGTMGSEDVRVDVWTGSAWQNLFTDLTSGWNNISVTDYLVAFTFTMRFIGGTETEDTSQDSWEIDCTLLHTWGVAPTANFSYNPEYPYTDETVTFNASDSYDPDGTIVSYYWDFGDGTNGTDEVTTHTYNDDGIYTVVLTVTDNDGLSDTIPADVIVLNRPPVAIFTESAEIVYTGETITFNASESYDPDGTIVSYFWDFGDGSNATGVLVDHTYVDNGNYTVTLTVTDDDSAMDSTFATKTVLNRAPVASFTESAETVYTGEAISFNASASYDLDGIIVNYFWDFGDGTNTTGEIVGHSYADNGTYTVTLTVTDNDGATDSTSALKTILNRSPVAMFTESATTALTGEAIYFNASDSYDLDGTILGYFWDFGDGANATGVIVEHSYVDDGVYNVTLTVTDDDGATDSTSATKTILNRPPVASFTESAETVLTGETIMFNASTSYDLDGSVVSYFWAFGDGTNATGVVVEHSYVDNGSYSVTLTITDDDGDTDTASATKTVLNRPPVASFTESAETVYTGETIHFNASQSYDQDGTIVSYFWDFGDGINASGVTIDHAYADDGSYTVTLTVTDDDGATDTAIATKTVLNRFPVASFTESAETVYTGETIYFNASGSSDPDGTIASYFWDFGDGANFTGAIVEHAYVDDGNYIVMLTVTDDDGATNSTTATKTVLNRPPIAVFTESAETVFTDELITFNASDSYDPDGTIVSYFWDFGDTTNYTGLVVSHAYADDGNYTVTLTITDDDGATDSATSTKNVLNRPPVALFTESAETVLVNETIYFNASASYDPDGYIVSYFWDFGDETNATGVTAEHAYADNGIYTVTLTITDNDGATASANATKNVELTPPVAIFTESAETVYTSETITFNASDSYDPDGYIVSYFWDFGDGTNTTDVVVEHAYADDGNYTVILTVTDDDGATDTATATKTVLNRSPIASFTESAETVLTGEVIYFNASASYDPDGSIVSYFWDFGDSTNATGVNVEHSYADDGLYTVSLTVTDDDGSIDVTTSSKTVLNRPPVAIFTYSPYPYPFINQTVTFNASASYDPDGAIVSYFWDFGDGSNATGVIATNVYLIEGMQTVNLTVTDNRNSTGTITHVIRVITEDVHDVAVVSVTPSATEVEAGQTLNITVIVKNEGTTIESFNVTAYTCPVNGWQLVETDGHMVWYSDGIDLGDFFILTEINVPEEAPVLTFDTKYDIETSWDFGFVQIYRYSPWISIENNYTTYIHDPHAHPDIIATLPGLTGMSEGWPGWMNMAFDLTDYAGETVMLGFRYMTDWGTLGEGWYVDNVRLNGNTISNEAFWPYAPSGAIPIQTKILINLEPSNQEILTFTWNTTDVEPSSYIIYAQATLLSGELDITDNTQTDGVVEVEVPRYMHDVAVNDISATVVGVHNGTVSAFNITVFVENKGKVEEIFNVTTYYLNASYFATVINTTTITLIPYEQATVTFNWNVTDVPRGKYTIIAEASPVPGETYIDNNTPSTPPTVGVGLIGDINGDSIVDVFDKVIVGVAFGASYNATDGMYWHQPPDFPEPCQYCPHSPNADLNNDGLIDIFDKVFVGYHFGEEC